MKYEHVLAFALDHPWAITPPMLTVIAGILARRIAGQEIDAAEVSALVARRPSPRASSGGDVAVIPIHGVIAPRLNLMSEMSGGTTFESLTNQLHDAMANADVRTIVFDVDSPGGSAAGATEFAHEVMKARATKTIIAQANHLMASAAYWPMSCATQIVASPSAMVGSVGVYTIHDDISEALAKLGVKRTVFAAGKYKAEGADGSALTEEAQAHVTEIVGHVYKRFVDDIAKGRGVNAKNVRNGYGEGRCLPAAEALGAGLIDKVATLSDTLARFTKSPRATTASTTTAQEGHVPTAQESNDAAWSNAAHAALLELDL